jgi:RNA polymerase sigma factor (sigma-70 family)
MSLATIRQNTAVLPEQSERPLPDGQLLERYVATHDQDAFAALVERYGPLVFGVCERVLRHSHDAEDAFQATFVVLARRAATLDGRGSLGNWLYAVAYRTAIKARQSAARRRARELQVLNMSTGLSRDEEAQEEWSDLRPLLDEELNQLPVKYRAPLVLCYMEGKTQEQAAHELGWPTGSMSRRMNRARDLLQERLARRGLALSTGFLFVLIAKNAGAAIVSPTLVGMTSKAALAFAAGPAGLVGAISGQVGSLAEEVLRTTAREGKRLLITSALLILIATMSGILTYEVAGYLQQGALWGCETPAKTEPQK